MLERHLFRRYAAPMISQASVPAALQWLEKQGTQANRDGMARYGIVAEKAFGVSVGVLQKYAKQIGRSHALAAGLWESGWYEAQMLAVFVEEPEDVTAAQMERWCQSFENWAICDTACFHLFDRTPHAWAKCESWCGKKAEFVKRTGFALLWSLSVHDKQATDGQFEEGLAWIEREATDDRNFVKKAVNMALRAVGKRNAALHAAALATAKRLAESKDATAAWVGRDAAKELSGPVVGKRLAGMKKMATK